MEIEDKKDLKSSLRRTMLARRQELDPKAIRVWSQKITEFIISGPTFQKAKEIMAYAPFRNEVDLSELFRSALDQGKQVLLPFTKWEGRQLIPVVVERYPEDLVPGRFGILEPRNSGQSRPVEAIDLVIVPGVAFDLKGYRLGYGQGFYDRFLTRLSTRTEVIGVAFGFQVVSTVYPEAHDFSLPMIVTENGVV